MSEVQGGPYEEWSRFLDELHSELGEGAGLPGARAEVAGGSPARPERPGPVLLAGAASPGPASILRALSLAVAVMAPAALAPAERLAVDALGPAAPRREVAAAPLRDPAPSPLPLSPAARGRGRDEAAPPPPRAPSDAGAPGPQGPARLERADAWVERIVDRFETRDLGLGEAEHRRLARVVVHEAELARIDPLLVLAVIHVESSFDVFARSDRGALGLMQLREPTLRAEAERAGLDRADPFDPATNLRMGIRYLRRLLGVFGREELALMAYNAGPNRILGYLRGEGIPDRFREYPRRVDAERRRLRRVYPELATAERLAVR